MTHRNPIGVKLLPYALLLGASLLAACDSPAYEKMASEKVQVVKPETQEIDSLLQERKLAANRGDSIAEANILEKISLLYYPDFPHKTVDYFGEATRILARAGRTERAATNYLNLASMYDRKLNDRASAIRHLQNSLELWRERGDNMIEANLLKYLGDIQGESGDFPAAKSNIRKSIALFASQGYQRGVAESQHNLAEVLFEQGQLDSARYYLQESARVWNEGNFPGRIFAHNLLLLKIEMAESNLATATDILESNTALAASTSVASEHRLEFHQLGQELYEKQGYAQKQQIHRQRFNALRDSLQRAGVEVPEW